MSADPRLFRCSTCGCSLMVTEKPAAGSVPATFLVTPCRGCLQQAARTAAVAAVAMETR